MYGYSIVHDNGCFFWYGSMFVCIFLLYWIKGYVKGEAMNDCMNYDMKMIKNLELRIVKRERLEK